MNYVDTQEIFYIIIRLEKIVFAQISLTLQVLKRRHFILLS